MAAENSPPLSLLLRQHRLTRELTQEELAEKSGLSPRVISDIERGGPHLPRRDTLALLAQALALTAEERAAFVAAAHAPRKAPPLAGHPAAVAASSSPLVGRIPEIDLLERHLHGQGPAVLLLAGEPGIGKTRLLQAMIPLAMRAGLRVLDGGCQRRGKEVPFEEPYAPLLSALQRYLRGQQPMQVRRDLRGCAWLVRLLPELADGPIDPLPAWTMSLAQERRLMGEAVLRFLANVAGPAGTLLVLDDLQWASPDALDLLAMLVRAAAPGSLRVIGAYRDTETQMHDPLANMLADLAHGGLAAQRALAPLAQGEAEQLLDHLLGPDCQMARPLRDRLLRRTGGVPFFITSCAEEVRSQDDMQTREKDADAPPWNVALSVRQRLGALPEVGREVMGLAAVVGRMAPLDLLTRVTGRPESEVLAGLDTACRARLLEQEHAAYHFSHDIIREVVEADLGAARRAFLHRRVAEALEQQPGVAPVEILAYHYRQSGAPAKAILYLVQAGTRARAQYAHAAAEGYYREALGLLDDSAPDHQAVHVGADAVGAPVGVAHQAWMLAALAGLGGVLLPQGKLHDAEMYLRRAIRLGHDLHQPARVLVPLYHELGDVLYHEGRGAEQVQIGEEGMALLHDDAESTEAALMNFTIALGHELLGNHDQYYEYLLRTARLITPLPYSPYWATFLWSVIALLATKNSEQARAVVQHAESVSHQHSADRALAVLVQVQQSNILSAIGDFRGAVAHLQAALDGHVARIDSFLEHSIWGWLAEFCLALGDLPSAARYSEQVRSALPAGSAGEREDNARHLGTIALAMGDVDTAGTLLEAVLACLDAGSRCENPVTMAALGRVYLAQGRPELAVHQFEQALMGATAFASGQWQDSVDVVLPNALSGIEEASGSAEHVRVLGHHLRAQHPGSRSLPRVLCLQPTTIRPLPRQHVHEVFTRGLSAAWAWHDPCGDCSYVAHAGLRITAANGQDLRSVNLSAPRLLLPAPSADFAVQTLCGPPPGEQPAIGGLLLWQDREQYLVLEWGRWGAADISFRGCLENEDHILGRGWLPGGRTWLRLERQGTTVRALCSADGQHWASAGEIEFPARGGEQVGLHAIGMIDRTIYHGAFSEGAAICFTAFDLWYAPAL